MTALATMTGLADLRLQRLLGHEDLAPLRKRLRQRYERAPLDETVAQLRINALTEREHAALASLLGRRQRYARSMLIDVFQLDDALQRAGIATSLRDALEQLDGPIVHLAAERVRLQTIWSDVIDGCRHPDLLKLLQEPTGIGLLRRLAKQDAATGAELCRRADAVLRHLPANAVTRSQLAADVLGDAHALDNGEATATLIIAVRRQSARPRQEGTLEDESDLPQSAATERIREVWAHAGVLVNELARPALFLNLPRPNGDKVSQPSGDPGYISLRSLLRAAPSWDMAGRKVYVCENPNLVAIASDRWGAGCAPLVCTDGMPGAAQRSLLSQLAQAGACLFYHGDFDWPGLSIGNHVMREHGAQSWRFGAADYLAAIRTSGDHGRALEGKPVQASWDAALADCMQRHGMAVAEEALAAALLPDLCENS